MAQPLAGLKVIEVGQALAAPLAGVVLADMGADVVKVEKPDGGDDARAWGPPFAGDASLYFHSQNRSKRSVTLDLKQPQDVAALERLAAGADILIQNLRPGVVDALGIGPEAMLARHPRLIYCSIWAFGAQGPLRLSPGFDPLLQAYGGMMSVTGQPDGPPTLCGASINDKAAGLFCVIGALAALRQRDATGRGCLVDTSLLEAAAFWVEGALNGYLMDGVVPQRHGTGASTITPYQAFDAADASFVLAAGNDRLWAGGAAVLGRPEWAADPRYATGPQRNAHRPELVAAIAAILRTRPRASWLAAFAAVGVPAAPVNDIGELARSEQLAALGLLQAMPDGLAMVGLPLSFDRERPQPQRGAPTLGEHNAEILGRLP